MTERFVIEKPEFDAAAGVARFRYRLAERVFTETLTFPKPADPSARGAQTFARVLDLTAIVLGVSYFKLRAPFTIETAIRLNANERSFMLDVYENGLGEFYARNDLRRFGQLSLDVNTDNNSAPSAPALPDRALLPIGGGKDSLVSVQLLEE